MNIDGLTIKHFSSSSAIKFISDYDVNRFDNLQYVSQDGSSITSSQINIQSCTSAFINDTVWDRQIFSSGSFAAGGYGISISDIFCQNESPNISVNSFGDAAPPENDPYSIINVTHNGPG